MSVRIWNDHPWTDDEVAYQLSRGREAAVERNRKDFPPNATQKEVVLSDEVVQKVKSISRDDLVDVLKEQGLSVTGSEKERRFRLAKYLQEQQDSN